MTKLILGSSSKSRLELLKKIGLTPDIIAPADINETPFKKENPIDYVKRIALAKCEKVIEKYKDGCVLTADTIVTRNRRIMQKAHNNDELLNFLKFLSGKTCQVITSFCVAKNGKVISQKLVSTKIKFKNFSKFDIEQYIKSGEGINKAGGIYVEGLMESFIVKLQGSYSNIQGLPVYEARNALLPIL